MEGGWKKKKRKRKRKKKEEEGDRENFIIGGDY